MYITYVPSRNSPPAVLLRESYRENGKVKSRTLANLSKHPSGSIEVLRRSLRGEQIVPASEAFEVIASAHHGHVQAVLRTMSRLGFAALLAARASRERDVAVAMVVARILEPESKLATTRWWQTSPPCPPRLASAMPMRTSSPRHLTGCSRPASRSRP